MCCLQNESDTYISVSPEMMPHSTEKSVGITGTPKGIRVALLKMVPLVSQSFSALLLAPP